MTAGPRDSAAPPGPSVTSRVADVLEAFGGAPSRLALSDISRRAGLPLTTTHRLVRELVARGLLERDDDNRYGIGLRLWEIASRASRTVTLRDAAAPFMGDLYESTHENVHLAVIDGDEAVYVDLVSGRESVHIVTRPGSRLPLHASGVGLVLLAHAPLETQERILASRLRSYTPHTITDPRQLRAVLAEVRRAGHAVSDRQIEEISVSVAAPVRDATGVVAALSIVIAAHGGEPRTFVPAVMAAAHGISRILGGR